ncbi:hypothetical protein NPX13_g4913 [Xylaria arbuscula]|uniref:Non-haem dioxygenase N-terminal domain-containing protein n=1 Tax=Xylaria arbuscula TaxID=114810 RepID=A0A9W8NFE2_9PEZI|nr:hypothetical protein NPX13_g4913 [Xylaria arbuscula]
MSTMPLLRADPASFFTPVAKLKTVVFSKILDRDPEQMDNLMSAIQTVGFFYLDLSDKYSEGMLKNLEKCSSVMEDWFNEPDTVKSQYKTVSMASHGFKPIGSQAGTSGGRDGWEVLKTGTLEMASRWGLIPPVERHYDTFSTFQRQCDYERKSVSIVHTEATAPPKARSPTSTTFPWTPRGRTSAITCIPTMAP